MILESASFFQKENGSPVSKENWGRLSVDRDKRWWLNGK